MKKQVLFKTITTIIAVIIIIGSLYFAHSFAKYKGRTPDYKIQVMLNIEPIDFVMFSFSGTEESLYIPVGGYYYISAWGGNGGLGGRGGAASFVLSASQDISSVILASAGGGGGGRWWWSCWWKD